MGKQSRRYAPEFKQQILALADVGRPLPELAKEFDVHVTTIRSWRAESMGGQAPSATPTKGLNHSDYEELQRLRKENRQLKIEREILSKATAWFANINSTSTTSTR